MRRPGPVPEEYWGCRRDCWNLGRHTLADGCERYTPPCRHPADELYLTSDGQDVQCNLCFATVTLREILETARVVISRGCICVGCTSHPPGECDGHCGAGTPVGWNLDPAVVLRLMILKDVEL